MAHFKGNLAQDRISIGALKVVSRLSSQGYQAYLVGGCVRDLILGKTPKDYDVATDAHPEDVMELFRNARPIGRRFKIVHVRFGHEIIEVATFRAPHNEAETEKNFSVAGMILSDNIYGTFEEDIQRRDFAMNALYYQPERDELLDEVGGLDDIEHRRIRLIGDPDSRFREDPVRMLRAIRFCAKLGFDIEDRTVAALPRLAHLLQDIPPARLFEEVLKLLMGGHGEASFDHLLTYELFGWLFPDTRRVMQTTKSEDLIRLALRSTDQRLEQAKPVTPAFILAALLWGPFVEESERLVAAKQSPLAAATTAGAIVIGRQQLYTSIPKRFSGFMREIWELQSRLPHRLGKRAEAVMAHKRFRAAYDFLVLREETGESLGGLADWWTTYQEADPPTRAEMSRTVAGKRHRRRKKRPIEDGHR